MSVIGINKGIFFKPNGKKLAKYLESLGPIFTKFGQLLSTRPDVVGDGLELPGMAFMIISVEFGMTLIRQAI